MRHEGEDPGRGKAWGAHAIGHEMCGLHGGDPRRMGVSSGREWGEEGTRSKGNRKNTHNLENWNPETSAGWGGQNVWFGKTFYVKHQQFRVPHANMCKYSGTVFHLKDFMSIFSSKLFSHRCHIEIRWAGVQW